MTTIAALNVTDNGFLFKFDQEVTTEGLFKEDNIGSIAIVRSVDSSVNTNRWATILKTGPTLVDAGLVPGARVLVEHLQWSRAIKLSDGSSIWKTDESKVLAIEV